MRRVKPLDKVTLNSNGYLKLGFPHFYKWFKKHNKKAVSQDKAREVLRRVFELCWQEIIVNYWVCTFPYNLGKVYISESYSLRKNKYKDWIRSREVNKLVHSYCFETDGRKPYIKYQRSAGVPVKYAKVYRFEPTRGSKETCSGYRGLWGHIKKQGLKSYRPHIQ